MDWLVASTIKTRARFLATYHYKKNVVKNYKWCKGAVSDNTSKPLGYFLCYKKKHLQRYVDEFTFRFNTRNLGDFERFELYLHNVA